MIDFTIGLIIRPFYFLSRDNVLIYTDLSLADPFTITFKPYYL